LAAFLIINHAVHFIYQKYEAMAKNALAALGREVAIKKLILLLGLLAILYFENTKNSKAKLNY
jgi:hypothetical protein